MRQESEHTHRRAYLKGIGTLATAGVTGLAGCSGGRQGGGGSGQNGGSGKGTSGKGGAESGATTLVVGTAASATANYAAMQGLGAAINQNSKKVYLSVRPNDGMAANVGALNRGQFDLALLTDWNAKQLKQGSGAYANIDFNMTQMLHTATTEWLLISNNPDITSYSDIDSKTRVSAGPAGTQVRTYFESIFNTLGLAPQMSPVGFGSIGSALAEGRIDVGIAATNNAASAAAHKDADIIEPGWVQQIKSTVDARVLKMKKPWFKKTSDEFTTFAIPKSMLPNGYTSAPKTSPGMVQATFLCGPANASYDAVYEMLKTAWKQRNSMGTYHDFLTYFKYDDHWTRYAFEGYPFHAAAADFYKEVGVWDDSYSAAETPSSN